MAQLVKNPPAVRETWIPSLAWEDPLEKGTAPHSSILAWRMPWTVHGAAESQTRPSDFFRFFHPGKQWGPASSGLGGGPFPHRLEQQRTRPGMLAGPSLVAFFPSPGAPPARWTPELAFWKGMGAEEPEAREGERALLGHPWSRAAQTALMTPSPQGRLCPARSWSSPPSQEDGACRGPGQRGEAPEGLSRVTKAWSLRAEGQAWPLTPSQTFPLQYWGQGR